MVAHNGHKPLTLEEHALMWLLSRGRSVKEIAQFIGIKPDAVERRFERVRGKLGARTTVQAMAWWSASSDEYAASMHSRAARVDQLLRDRANGVTEEDC